MTTFQSPRCFAFPIILYNVVPSVKTRHNLPSSHGGNAVILCSSSISFFNVHKGNCMNVNVHTTKLQNVLNFLHLNIFPPFPLNFVAVLPFAWFPANLSAGKHNVMYSAFYNSQTLDEQFFDGLVYCADLLFDLWSFFWHDWTRHHRPRHSARTSQCWNKHMEQLLPLRRCSFFVHLFLFFSHSHHRGCWRSSKVPNNSWKLPEWDIFTGWMIHLMTNKVCWNLAILSVSIKLQNVTVWAQNCRVLM